MQQESRFNIQGTLAIFLCVGFVTIVAVWMFYPPKGDPSAIAVLTTLTGALGAAFGQVVSYYFGSTSGSKEKDATITAMAVNPITGTGNGKGAVTTIATTTTTDVGTKSDVVIAWWNLLTEPERQAITEAAKTDPRVKTFMASSATDQATTDDLAYLVANGLLTKDRATEIQKST